MQPQKSIRQVKYTLETSQKLNFKNSLPPQISGITSTVTGSDKGLQSLKENRNDSLRMVQTSDTGKPKYSYTISTNMEFPANSFQNAAQPLPFRHVVKIKVQALRGTDSYVSTEVNTLNKFLKPLNFFLKNETYPKKKQDLPAWNTKLNTIIDELNQSFAEIKESKILTKEEVEAMNLKSINKKPFWQILPGKGVYKYISAATITLIYALGLNQFLKNLGFFKAGLFYMLGRSLEEILLAFLSDENMSQKELNSFVSQYLQAAQLRPEELNARALFNDIHLNSQSILLFGSLLSMTSITLWLAYRIIHNRA